VVSFPGPHPPLDAPGKYADLIPPESIELPPNVPDSFVYKGATHDRDSMRRLRANYYGKMALIDDNIGRIIGVLKRRGTWDETLVIFSSDHGEMMGAHGHMSKGRFFEESARVPLVMRWPGRIRPGMRTPALTQLFDIYPTIVEAIGGNLSPGHFAVSQLPVATGAKQSVRDAVFSEIGKGPINFMVRTERYAWWIHQGEEALYDMEADPWQMHNLIDSPAHQVVIEEIRHRHLRYFMETQYNLSADYVARLARMKESVEGDEAEPQDRIYRMFRKNVGLE
jgi:arylsulfatase A-like enzyme